MILWIAARYAPDLPSHEVRNFRLESFGNNKCSMIK